MTHRTAETEFSFKIRPADIGHDPVTWTIEATPAECVALAERFALISLDSLRAELQFEWLRGHRFLRLRGRILAQASQCCVVTLQPVPRSVDEPFEILFLPRGAAWQEGMIELDDVEPLDGDELDIAEVAAEEFALMLDPYPRIPGAELANTEFGPRDRPGKDESPTPGGETGPARNRPFEVLARLKGTK